MAPTRALSSGSFEAGMDAGYQQTIEEVILLTLFLVSTAANSLALLVFCRRPGLRTISNRFVINLLGTNLVTTCLLAPALFGEHSVSPQSKQAWVQAGEALAAVCNMSALLAVLLIALDQHHAVTDPLRCHTRLMQRRPAALCVCTWLVAGAVALVRAAIAACKIYFPTFPLLEQVEFAYALTYLCLGVLVPAAIVCVMYARIYSAARKSGLRARANNASVLQLHEPHTILPDLVEESEGLTLRIDASCPDNSVTMETERAKFGPFLLPPGGPHRCPSVASLRNSKKEGKSNEDLRKGLPSVSSAPSLAAPLLVQPRVPVMTYGSKMTSLRCRISNASLFRYREESRAARVGLLTGALVSLHVPHAVAAILSATNNTFAGGARSAALAMLLVAAAASPFLFALRSRRVQREARRLLLPEKSAWDRHRSTAAAAAADGQRARAALELLRTLSPGTAGAAGAEGAGDASGNGSEGACRSSFSSGGSTQLSSASEE